MPLPASCEKKPVNADLKYVPANGFRYEVQDKDSFFTLVNHPKLAGTGVKPLDICFFNFKTRDPKEINWYLYHKVGCRKTTRDGKNYCFSSADDPGIIYLPTSDDGGVCSAPEVKECVGSRKSAILNPASGCQFVVKGNPSAKSDEPIYELSSFSDVNRNCALIERVAKESGVDARLIRAIMYMETTHGYYDAPLALFGKNKSILPMNINVQYWGEAFGRRAELEKPYPNIKAGAEVLFRIQSYLPDGAPISHIATLYNNINAHQVNDYGARVQKIYESQPWLKKGLHEEKCDKGSPRGNGK